MGKYPLEQLAMIKKNRFDRAVKVLEEKKALLETEKKRLAEVTEVRDKELSHKMAKLTQLREALDAGTTTDKVQQMKAYLKVVDGRLAEKEQKVKEQQALVDLAQKQVDLATEELFQRKKDLEKLDIHKEEWSKEQRISEVRKEAAEHDEHGAAGFEYRKKRAREKPDKR